MTKSIINLIIAVLFTTTSIFASNINSISTIGSKAFIVDTKLWKSEYLNVEIRNNEGLLIFEDKYSTEKGKKFNFENLPLGIYSILLENELKSTTQRFVISSDDLTLIPDVSTVYKPVIAVAENHIDLNYLSFGNPISVSIYDRSGQIFTVDRDNQSTVNQRFDTSELPNGIYSFNVSSGNKSYSKKFRK